MGQPGVPNAEATQHYLLPAYRSISGRSRAKSWFDSVEFVSREGVPTPLPAVGNKPVCIKFKI